MVGRVKGFQSVRLTDTAVEWPVAPLPRCDRPSAVRSVYTVWWSSVNNIMSSAPMDEDTQLGSYNGWLNPFALELVPR